jgi:hypothetical protein
VEDIAGCAELLCRHHHTRFLAQLHHCERWHKYRVLFVGGAI